MPPLRRTIELTLDLMRGTETGKDEDYPLGAALYVRSRDDRRAVSAEFPWSQELHTLLREVWKTRPQSEAVKRVGLLLREFLVTLGWEQDEERLDEALNLGDEVRISLRSNAAELCRLPLELLVRTRSGQSLGRTTGCHIQWEHPAALPTMREPDAPATGGILLVASAGVSDAGHVQAIRAACRAQGYPEWQIMQVPGASLGALAAKLEEIRAQKGSVAVLHLLCHGGLLEGTAGAYGLKLVSSRNAAAEELVDPQTLAAMLEKYRGLVRSVVLCACHSGEIDERGVLGSMAQNIHRAGIASVVAFRCLLRPESAELFSGAFYDALLAGEPLHRAVSAGRMKLAEDPGSQEWAAVQLHARRADGSQLLAVPRRADIGAPKRAPRKVQVVAASLGVLILALLALALPLRSGQPKVRTALAMDSGAPESAPPALAASHTRLEPDERLVEANPGSGPPASRSKPPRGSRGATRPVVSVVDAGRPDVSSGPQANEAAKAAGGAPPPPPRTESPPLTYKLDPVPEKNGTCSPRFPLAHLCHITSPASTETEDQGWMSVLADCEREAKEKGCDGKQPEWEARRSWWCCPHPQ